MNLLTDPWIPSDTGIVTPTQLLADGGQPRWGRGDWDISTCIMLVALLQSAVVRNREFCPDEDAWDALYARVPGRTEIDEVLSPFRNAFDGRVFEDFAGVPDGKEVPVSALLPDSPGDSTVNTKVADITLWVSETIQSFTEAEARIAIYSDSLWGMRWGRGHRQGPRGESRITTLVEPEDGGTLWQQVWLNVLPLKRWEAAYGSTTWKDEIIFPWLAPPRTVARPADSHPLTVYWAMPRRITLNIPENGQIRRFLRKDGGTEYEGWTHPLTPYVYRQEKVYAARLTPNHIGYDDWAGITLMEWHDVRPAPVVNEFVQRRWTGGALRVRACGWSLGSSGEAAAWVERVGPLLASADPDVVAELLQAAEERRKRLARALKKALPGDVPSYPDRLYAKTEADFYRRVREAETDGWDRCLYRAARGLYDEATDYFRCDPIEVARQRARL